MTRTQELDLECRVLRQELAKTTNKELLELRQENARLKRKVEELKLTLRQQRLDI